MLATLGFMGDAQKILGAGIRALREQRNLSQENLSDQAGISYQYLSGIENGKENFTIQVLESLANALEIPLEMLVAAAYEKGAIAKGTRPRR